MIATSKTILSTSNLSIGYKSKNETFTIANDLNLNLTEGKLTTLIGGNGIGKSTLLRTLTGIQNPLKGNVYLNEKDIKNYATLDLAQNLSVVLTEKLPPSNLTVYEIVALGRQPYTNWIGKLSKVDILKIENAIQLTGIEDFIHKKHYQISDGQLQKVLIARALSQDTPIIVLDEPTTHLDLLHKISVFKLLKKLCEETEKSILFSTHDIDLAIQLSDDMIVMMNENCIQDTPCNLIENNTFNYLFVDHNISFDKDKGRFTFNQ